MSNDIITVGITVKGDGIGLKILDYASAANLLVDERPVVILPNPSQRTDISILFVCQNGGWQNQGIGQKDIHSHDLLFLSNNDEPLSVYYDFLTDNADLDKAYILSNSYTHQDHLLHKKIIWTTNDPLITRQFWTNAVFPIYHQHHRLKTTPRDRSLVFINGANRSWRHHVITVIKTLLPDLPVLSNISDVIHETNDAYWETEHDSMFRDFVNSTYPITRNSPSGYYDKSIEYPFFSSYDGLPEMAKIPLGYDIMEEYYQYQCVIFPETGWCNNELSPTEKILKCFFTKSLPFPVGGARINQLYNELGFKTAWNFLPERFQKYDDELDHLKRACMIADSIAWYDQHRDILVSPAVTDALEENWKEFLSNNLDIIGTNKVWDILNKCWQSKKTQRC